MSQNNQKPFDHYLLSDTTQAKTIEKQVKHNLWSDYLRSELRNPHIPAYRPA